MMKAGFPVSLRTSAMVAVQAAALVFALMASSRAADVPPLAAPLDPIDSLLPTEDYPVATLGPADLQLIDETRVSDRLVELTFQTPALTAPTKVRVLLPTGYDSSSNRRYPVLYLLHGAGPGPGYPQWTDSMHAEAVTADYAHITVMPDGGSGAYYTDWYNAGNGGPPMWETYHINQLVPWIDQHYRTTGKRSGRAIAGLSKGGFGTASYAARHPDLFVAAASFSGALDNMFATWNAFDALTTLEGGGPGSMWGLQADEEVRWRGHNPVDLAENLRTVAMQIRTGNGLPGGPYSESDVTLIDPLEADCREESAHLHQRLHFLGIDHVWDDYGAGTHSAAYWERDLRVTLPVFARLWAQSLAYPTTFSYSTIDASYRQFGWAVEIERTAWEFSTLRVNGKSGFSLTGSGSATVTTQTFYSPGKPYDITISGPHQNATVTAVAGADRRLSIPLTMGPANPYQEYSGLAELLGSSEYTVDVRIASH